MNFKLEIMRRVVRIKRKKEVWKYPQGQFFAVPRSGKKPVKTFLYRPKNASAPLPVLFNLHGGAWVGGDASQMDSYCIDMAEKCGALIVNINYTKVDVRPFPYPQEEVRDTVLYFKDHAEEYGIDTTKFALIGYSAGGHLAAASALMLHDGGFNVSAQVLCYPFLNFELLGSLGGNESQNADMDEFFFDRGGDKRDPYISPALATDKQIRRLAPTIFVCCGTDILTEQAKAYDERLRAHGVLSVFKVYDEALHGFLEVNHKEYIPSAAKTPKQEALSREAEDYIASELNKLWRKSDEIK